MGASFRNTDMIKALAGCDNLTIAPKLLDELANDNADLPRALVPETKTGATTSMMDEASFRWELNADTMATEKLAEGIRNFHKDHIKLVEIIAERMR